MDEGGGEECVWEVSVVCYGYGGCYPDDWSLFSGLVFVMVILCLLTCMDFIGDDFGSAIAIT